MLLFACASACASAGAAETGTGTGTGFGTGTPTTPPADKTPRPEIYGPRAVDAGFVFSVEILRTIRGNQLRVIRTTTRGGRRVALWRPSRKNRFEFSEMTANGGSIAITEEISYGNGGERTRVVRIDYGGKHSAVVASGYVPGFDNSPEFANLDDPNSVGQFCGDSVAADDVTDAGEVIVHRIAGTRTGVFCKQAVDSNRNTFEKVGLDGTRKTLFDETRTAAADQVRNGIQSIDFETGFEGSSRGRFFAVSDFETGYVINMDTGERSPGYRSPLATATATNHAIDVNPSAAGTAIVIDRNTDQPGIFGDNKRAFLYPVAGDATTFKALSRPGRSTYAFFCGDRVVSFEDRYRNLAARMRRVRVLDAGGNFLASLNVPKRADVLTGCDSRRVYTEPGTFGLHAPVGVKATRLP